ncbi:hypothetical protein [Companilactobacillus halodurans]|uniref:hypothetical protein n=2 Tax=Bacilli TaxID=91061 RepID=UPI001EE30747|nr:hypothetical protein [Companilactobacillus halodurans]
MKKIIVSSMYQDKKKATKNVAFKTQKDRSAKTAELSFFKTVAFSHTDQLSQLERNACRRWARGNNGLFPRT